MTKETIEQVEQVMDPLRATYPDLFYSISETLNVGKRHVRQFEMVVDVSRADTQIYAYGHTLDECLKDFQHKLAQRRAVAA